MTSLPNPGDATPKPAGPAPRTRLVSGVGTFPVIGEPLPDRRLYGADAAAFAAAASRHGRDWLYHVRVEPRATRPPTAWPGIGSPAILPRLCRQLGLKGEYRLEPLEFLPG